MFYTIGVANKNNQMIQRLNQVGIGLIMLGIFLFGLYIANEAKFKSDYDFTNPIEVKQYPSELHIHFHSYESEQKTQSVTTQNP